MGRQAHNDAPARHERPGGGRSGVFADEPTGNLDSKAGQALLEFLRGSVREFGQTVVMVTHDPFAASYADRVVLLRDVPKSSYDPGTCLTTGSPSLGDCTFQPVERSRRLGDVAVTSARLAGAEVVDPTPWLCYQDLCPVVVGGTLTYRDTDHITTE